MKVLKNFDDFVRKNRLNENLEEENNNRNSYSPRELEDDEDFDGDDFDDEEFDGDDFDDEDFDGDDFDDEELDGDDLDGDDLDDEDLDGDDLDGDDLDDEDLDGDDLDDDDDDDDDDDLEDEMGTEEEEGEYKGNLMMKELADLLDTEVTEENEIVYNGHKINFFSETEMFHVGKKTFETPEEVAEYVQSSEVEDVTNERHSHKNRKRR
jgi:hypothetical protein